MRSYGFCNRPWLLNLFLISSIIGFGVPVKVRADGCFVWNKEKDIAEPTQKAILIYDAGREDLILQVKYEGPVDEFGWLIPVPNLPTVQKGSMECFYELSRYTQEKFPFSPHAGRGRGLGDNSEAVQLHEIKTVGAYEVAVLSTKNAGSLENWLATNHFSFPKDKTAVLDSYIKQRWYFVAVKVHTGGGFLNWLANWRYQSKLASGELHPLQISFVSDQCVFPLKISSVSGKPSEVQVYVLSPEPFIEKGMFDQKVSTVRKFSGPATSATASLDQMRSVTFTFAIHRKYSRLGAPIELPLDRSVATETRWSVAEEELAPYASVRENELPECSQQIPRLKGKRWWLTKQTWTFQPPEMRDLVFQPAIPVFLDEMANNDGFFAAENLAQLGTNAYSALLTALQGTNLAARIYAAPFLQGSEDPQLSGYLPALLKDSNPQLRLWAAAIAGQNRDSKFLQPLLDLSQKDADDGVRYEAALALGYYCTNESSPLFLKMLKSEDLNVRASALFALRNMPINIVQIQREDVLPVFRASWTPAINMAFRTAWILGIVHGETGISCQEAIPLLQNPLTHARLLGLEVLRENANKQSIELAIPMLEDPEERVRNAAEGLLRLLTKQDFPQDQPDQWQKWWTENKTNFVVQFHPEELRAQFPNFRTGNIGSHPPPTIPPENSPK